MAAAMYVARRPFLIALIGVLTVFAARPAVSRATVLASATFDDNIAGTALVPQGGGTGWSSDFWSSNSGLTGTAATNVLVVLGDTNRAEVPITSSNGGTAFRGLTTPLADVAGNTYYFQFDAQSLNDNMRFFGVSLYSGTTERFLMGQGSTFSTWTINNLELAGSAPTGTAVSTVDSSDNEANLLVKIVFGGVGSPETLTFWVNPDYAAPESGAVNDAKRVGTFTTGIGTSGTQNPDWGTIDRVRVGGGNTGGTPSLVWTPHWIDNILITDHAPFSSADFDGDDDVDGDDFLAWQRGLGTESGATLAQGDANSDGDVDGDDLAVWRSQFGAGSAATAIPEPASILLLAIAALAWPRGRARLFRCACLP